MQSDDNVTVMFIGDTGSGKSALGNMFLKQMKFEESEKPAPCTLIPTYHSTTIDGRVRGVIDTEGFDDGEHITEEQIHKLAQVMKHFDGGINAIGVVIQASIMRFTSSVKDVIKFIYDAFGKQILTRLCIVFTFCDADFPDRDTKAKYYRPTVTNYLKKISGEDNIPDIPLFYVNCRKPDEEFVVEEMTRFYGWASVKTKIKSQDFKEVPLGYSVEDEEEVGVSLGCEQDGENTVEKFIDRKRKKVTPNNGDPARYTEWTTTKEYTQVVVQVLTEDEKNKHHSYEYENGNKYEVLVDMQRKVSINNKTGEKKEGPWYEVNRQRRLVSKTTVSEDVVEAKECIPCDGGYKMVTFKKKRQIKVDPDGNVSYGEYSEVPDSRQESMIKTEPQIIREERSDDDDDGLNKVLQVIGSVAGIFKMFL